MPTITRGARVVVTLRDGCQHEKPHREAEDGMRGTVTGDNLPGDHSLFVLFGGRARECRTPAASLEFLPLGRAYHPDELEVIPTLP